MNKPLPTICYWCGTPLEKDEFNREHVPSLGFFPKGHRTNLITVPSCKDHNNLYSNVDEKFQIYLKLHQTNKIAYEEVKCKVKRSIERTEKAQFVQDFNKNSGVGIINEKGHFFTKLESDEVEIFVQKIIRGLYFYHTGKPAKGIIHWVSKHILFEGLDSHSIFDFVVEDLDNRVLKKGDCHNPEVFTYSYLEIGGLFTVLMDFYEGVEFFGTVYPEGFTFENFDINKHGYSEEELKEINNKTKITFPKT